MPRLFTCSQGHRWKDEARGSAFTTVVSVCPQCGAVGTLLAEDGSEGERATPPPQPQTGHSTEDEVLRPPVAAKHGPAGKMALIAGYEVLGELGRGGMGVVYQARQISLKRVVALKMIKTGVGAGPEEFARFQTEAEAVARLQHPNIVQIHEVGAHDGLPYFSLEFIEGGTLARLLQVGLPSLDRAAHLAETLARAVSYSHQRGIVHRDLKPANVLLTADGQPKITDFGLAKHLEGPAGQTQTGAVMGTPSYMAPEQAAGKTKEVGPLTDVYALGAVLYELLTGRPPFRGETAQATLQQVQFQDPVPPSRFRKQMSRDLETICLKCLAKEPAARYSSALALAQDLERFQAGEAILARREGVAGRLWRRVRRHKVAAASVLVMSLVLGTVAPVSWRAKVLRREASADRHVTNLKSELEAKLKAGEWTAAHLDEMETLLREMDSIAPGETNASRRRIDQGLAEFVDAALRRNRLQPEDIAHIDSALRSLEARAPNLAVSLREARDRRYRSWETVFDLKPPFTGLSEILPARQVQIEEGTALVRKDLPENAGPLGNLTVLSSWPCDGNVQLEAAFDESWDAGVGLLLHAEGAPTGKALCIGFSPDSRTVVTGHEDGKARLWDAATGTERASLPGHAGAVRSVAFAPVGRKLATAGDDRTVRLWDPGTGKVVATSPGHTSAVRSVAFAPDGRTLASGGSDRTVKLWDANTGLLQRTLTGAAAEVTSLAYAPDGGTLAAGVGTPWSRTGGDVQLRDTTTHRVRAAWKAHPSGVTAVAFAPDGRTLASAGSEGLVKLWDTATGREVASLQGWAATALCLAYLPGGKSLFAGYTGERIKEWDVLTKKEVTTLFNDADEDQVLALACSPDGRSLASVSGTGTAKLWDLDWKLGRAVQVERAVLGPKGYAFVLSPVAPSALQPASALATPGPVRKTGGVWRCQFFRNGLWQWEQPVPVPPGPLRLRASQEGDQLKFQVNELPPVVFRDVLPARPQAGVFGIHWPARVRLRGLHAARQALPPDRSPLEQGDGLYAQGQFAEALGIFQDATLWDATPAASRTARREADYKAALCHLALNRPDEAVVLLTRLALEPDSAGDPWAVVAAYQLMPILWGKQRFQEAEAVVAAMAAQSPDLRNTVVLIPDAIRKRVIMDFYLADNLRLFLAHPRLVRLLELAVRFTQEGGADGYRRSLLRGLFPAYLMTGQAGRALGLVQEMLQTAKAARRDGPVPEDVAGHLELVSWLLRAGGDPRSALTELDDWLFEKPGIFRPGRERTHFRLLVERARIHVALQEWEQAEQDLDRSFALAAAEKLPYFSFSSACLIRGFLFERRGAAAQARDCWRRGLLKSWRQQVPEEVRNQEVSWSTADAFALSPSFHNWILASLTDDFSPGEGGWDYMNGVFNVLAQPMSVEHRKMLLTPLTEKRDQWRTPRGLEYARQFAFRQLSYADHYWVPARFAAAEFFHQGAMPGNLSPEQDELIWDLGKDGLLASRNGKVSYSQILKLFLAWKGINNAFGWRGVAEGLDPSLRGPTAYVLGLRYRHVLKRPKEEVVAFFRTARDDAPSPSPLRRLAEIELEKLKAE